LEEQSQLTSTITTNTTTTTTSGSVGSSSNKLPSKKGSLEGMNICFIIEGEEEEDSIGFEQVLKDHQEFMKGTNIIIISNTYWIGEQTPCLIYGLRGSIDVELTVFGPKNNLHSGNHGGVSYSPALQLSHIVSKLCDSKGNILIPGFYEHVTPLQTEEKELFQHLEFNVSEYQESIGIPHLLQDDKVALLASRWCLPSLSVTGKSRCSHNSPRGLGFTTGSRNEAEHGNIVSKVASARINIRHVPNQSAEDLLKKLEKYVFQELEEQGNEIIVRKLAESGEWWLGSRKNEFYEAAERAIDRVWKCKPLYVRGGGTMRVTSILENILKAPALHLPIGQASDRAHLENERLRLLNFHKGKDVFKAFIQELSSLPSQYLQHKEIK
jgi:acetylornithine deacetylase/succinyl-diaminopimelate desuccinylase-like protein